MVFTREDILKIQNALLQLGRKDSEFKDANTPLNSDDYIAILQDGINKKVSINNLLSTLGLLKKDDFINVLKELDIAFDPEEIKKELEVKLPKTLEEFSMEKEKAEKELVTVEDEMNSATTKIEELGLRKDEALANQERLNRYFDLALEGNINITRDEITSLLEKFNFSEEEQREAAKLLMFPEDGLYEYEKSLKGIKSKSISDVFKEAKEEIKTEEINKETPVVEAPLHEEEPSFNFDFNIFYY